MICKYAEIFCWKNVSSFCSAKATHIFSAKNFRILYIESTKTVNEMTLNELVKLTTLWTTGPRKLGAVDSYHKVMAVQVGLKEVLWKPLYVQSKVYVGPENSMNFTHLYSAIKVIQII